MTANFFILVVLVSVLFVFIMLASAQKGSIASEVFLFLTYFTKKHWVSALLFSCVFAGGVWKDRHYGIRLPQAILKWAVISIFGFLFSIRITLDVLH